MKKYMIQLVTAALVLSLTACGENSTNPAQGENNTEKPQTSVITDSQSKPSEQKKKPTDSKEITLKKLMEAEESPEDDFVVIDHDNGHVELLQYVGSSEVVVIPQTWKGKEITSIASYVFGVNSNVKAIRLSDSIEEVEMHSFGINQNLEIVVCGSGLKTIREMAFQNCSKLHTVVLNDGLETVVTTAFGGCESLTEIEIPSGATNIELGAFYGQPKDFLIIGEAGSAAEQYAADEGFQFQAK